MLLEFPAAVWVRIACIMNKFEKVTLHYVLISKFHAIFFILFNLCVDHLHVEAV